MKKRTVKTKYTVLKARLTWDKFKVEAETPEDAAQLVARGKIPETEQDTSWLHDATYDSDGVVTVLHDDTNDKANLDDHGFSKVLCQLES